MDILKYGPDVEVLSPATLREKIAALHEAAAKRSDSRPVSRRSPAICFLEFRF